MHSFSVFILGGVKWFLKWFYTPPKYTKWMLSVSFEIERILFPSSNTCFFFGTCYGIGIWSSLIHFEYGP